MLRPICVLPNKKRFASRKSTAAILRSSLVLDGDYDSESTAKRPYRLYSLLTTKPDKTNADRSQHGD